MKSVIQRVSQASLHINQKLHTNIGRGLLMLVGIATTDTSLDVQYIVKKVAQCRIFEDDEGKMNRSLLDIGGELLLVSQFTLMGDSKKGNRPSFTKAMKPEQALSIYNELSALFEKTLKKPVASGIFGADMQIHLINDGPVTIIHDSRGG